MSLSLHLAQTFPDTIVQLKPMAGQISHQANEFLSGLGDFGSQFLGEIAHKVTPDKFERISQFNQAISDQVQTMSPEQAQNIVAGTEGVVAGLVGLKGATDIAGTFMIGGRDVALNWLSRTKRALQDTVNLVANTVKPNDLTIATHKKIADAMA